jgi:hypothetical protein
MRIVFNEIKKVFNLRAIILLVLISLIMYRLFISFEFKYFPNGRPEKDYYKISIQMLKDYGTSMDEKEFENFKELYNKQVEEANKYLQSIPEFVKKGITTNDKFNEIESKDARNEELTKLRDKVIFQDNVDIFWELQTREHMIDDYERIENISSKGSSVLKKSEVQRYNEVAKNGSLKSILPHFVFDNYNRLAKNMAILIIISIIFMISPIYIKDRSNNVNCIQYTTKTGRKIFKVKLVAALISSFIIISLHLALFFILYSQNNIGIFLKSNINSIFNYYMSWYDLSFMQYIMLTAAGMYILGLALTLVVTFISKISPNYITLAGLQVPITFIVIGVSSSYLMNNLTIIRYPKYFQTGIYLTLVLTGIVLMVVRWRKEKIEDIIN